MIGINFSHWLWRLGLLIISIIIFIVVKNKVWSYYSTKNMKRIVVFDLDETLGSFIELSIFWNALCSVLEISYTNQEEFIKVMKAFPEFLRPKIIEILKYVVSMRRKGNCSKIMIYTNNQGPRAWTEMIASYFSHVLGEEVFNQIIAAFKVQNTYIELGRTTNNKTITDLIRIADIPKNAKICFIDDQYHALMNDEQVYYINVKPYVYSKDFKMMAEHYYDLYKPKMSRSTFIKRMTEIMDKTNYTSFIKPKAEVDIDLVISKGVLLHLERFFRTVRGNNTRRLKLRHENRFTRTKR